ncbi:MAG: peptide chain release factor N(5)-glutamine methyltransferase [Rhodothermales bacterium]|nr:peptide chain release factor N(5)-glutamine methyltransferase [Rhodothermales bacterium]
MQQRTPPRTVHQALAEAIKVLNDAAIEDARRNVEWLMGEVLGVGRASLYAYPERLIAPHQEEAFAGMLARRARHEPLQHILGYTEFLGHRIRVSPEVLIPRPETEQLVEHGLKALAGRTAPRVLDIGTGSGCIAIAVKHRRPDARVVAVDISESALCIARENAIEAQTDIEFARFDLLEETLADLAASPFDLILSNPPYIPDEDRPTMDPEVIDFEPHQALFAGPDPLVFYDAIARQASPALRVGGAVLVEIYAAFAAEVSDRFRSAGFSEVETHADFAGRLRFVHARNPPFIHTTVSYA